MEVNILPQAVVGNVVLLQGGGARVTIPPGNGFTITVNPVEFAAAGALGAGAGEGAANNIAAITGVFFFSIPKSTMLSISIFVVCSSCRSCNAV